VQQFSCDPHRLESGLSQQSRQLQVLCLTHQISDANFAHRPGQYVTLRVSLPDGQKVMRNYSISNRPGSEQFRISVKRERALQEGAPHGVSSSFLNERLQEGDVVEISPPAVSSRSRPSASPDCRWC